VTQSPRSATLCVLLALIAATLGLIFAVSHMTHSVWYDESLTNIIARQPSFSGLVKSAMDLKAYPPAFFVVVRWVHSFDEGPGGMRLPSAVFGFLATFAVFALGRIAGGPAAGALASAFFVLTPGALRYFSDGNAYTLLMLASAVSTVCLYRALQTDRRLHWMLYGASATLGLATHTIFVFHLSGQILAALWYRFVLKPNGTQITPRGSKRRDASSTRPSVSSERQ
jgi:4-amino-4-deoxy-L-arabinose transferase-like glycosyltransferase